jgi:hypothetical protein
MDPRQLGPDVIPDETERFANMSPAQRLQIFVELCELTDSIVRGRPDADALRRAHPRSEEAEALWARLMTQQRRGKHEDSVPLARRF